MKTIEKYAGYYIVASILVSLFVDATLQPVMHMIIENTIEELLMFMAILHMLLGDIRGDILLHISDTCVRCTSIAVVILSIFGIGLDKILKLLKLRRGDLK